MIGRKKNQIFGKLLFNPLRQLKRTLRSLRTVPMASKKPYIIVRQDLHTKTVNLTRNLRKTQPVTGVEDLT